MINHTLVTAGTLNVFEALGSKEKPPPLLFTSTYKGVRSGKLPGFAGVSFALHSFAEPIRFHGIDESRGLEVQRLWMVEGARPCGLPSAEGLFTVAQVIDAMYERTPIQEPAR